MADKIRLDTKYDLDGEYEPSDSEDEYSENDRQLLAKASKYKDDSGSEEEVYGFSESDSEKDIADSDVEGQEASGDEIPDPKAWGQKKKSFYSTDYVDEDYGGFGKEEEAATLEEKEARLLQTKLAEQLEDEDFSLDYFTSKKAEKDVGDNDNEILIKSDLSQMSKRQKLQLLEKESPEFSGLIDDFKTKLLLAKNTLLPILNLVKQGKLPECSAIQFIKTKYHLILNYCTNISFYLLLKSKKKTIQNHPVIKRLYQYRQMLNQIEQTYENTIMPQIQTILDAFENNESVTITSQDISNKKRKINYKNEVKSSKKLKLLNRKDSEPNQTSDDDNDNVDKELESDNNKDSIILNQNQGMGNTDEGEKRAITYQMAKNKGLTPHRKKEQRNPRVKHRNKYRKAQIRRKGAVRQVRTEINRYAGEKSGIKSNVRKSIKIR